MAEEKKEDKGKSGNTDPVADIGFIIIVVLTFFILFGGFLASVLYQSQFGNALSSFFTSEVLYFIKILFIFLDVALIAFIVATVFKFNQLERDFPQRSLKMTTPTLREPHRLWDEIRALAESENPSDRNMAVLRADALLDDALDDRGYQGDGLAERLKIVDPTTLRSINKIWSAHRVRNTIAHNTQEQHPKEVIRESLRAYEEAFIDLGYLSKKK